MDIINDIHVHIKLSDCSNTSEKKNTKGIESLQIHNTEPMHGTADKRGTIILKRDKELPHVPAPWHIPKHLRHYALQVHDISQDKERIEKKTCTCAYLTM